MADIDGVHNANRGEIIIYRAEDNTIQLDVRMENETVWLNLNQMAMLFDRDKSVIYLVTFGMFLESASYRKRQPLQKMQQFK